jgi:hypothetical protein
MNTNKRAADVIRALMTVTKSGFRLFSDQTTFGRSIKVTGWSEYHYETAVLVLTRHGYEASIVTKMRQMPRRQMKYTVTRLYVNNKVA